jgi:hypothetical protein
MRVLGDVQAVLDLILAEEDECEGARESGPLPLAA